MAGSPYVSLKGSLGTTDMGDIDFSNAPSGMLDATDNGSSSTTLSPGGAIGYDFGDVRIEFEYFNRSQVEHDTSIALLTGGFGYDNQFIPYTDLLGPMVGGVNQWLAQNVNFNSQVDTETFFLNVYMESDTFFGYTILKGLEFYAGAGVGMAKHSTKTDLTINLSDFGGGTFNISDSASNTCVAYNVQVGAAYFFTDNIALDLGARYADLGEAELGSFIVDMDADKIVSKEIVASIRYTF